MDERLPLPTAAVRAIEERAFNAWPALQTLVADGWLLRFADGYTKRANSINAWQPTAPLAAILDHATPLYAGRGLPLIARLSPLAWPGDDEALASRGFGRVDETIVMTASLGSAPSGPDPCISVASAPSGGWLDGFAGANAVLPERRAIHDRMVAAIPSPAAFACLDEDTVAVAWGLAACERGMVGLFDIVTAPHARRRGAGRRLVVGLLDWAVARGASTAYLQVVATNHPAIALYRTLGFSEAYRYHYRIGPV